MIPMRRPTATLVALLIAAPFTTFGAGAAVAQADLTEAQKTALRSACGDDIQQSCAQDVLDASGPAKPVLQACIQENVQKFTRGCKRELIRIRMHQDG